MGGMGGLASMMLGGDEPDGDEGQSGEIPVPLSSLAQPDDKEMMQTPQAGDSVDFQVTATISRIDGEMAYVIPQAVNGQPLDEQGEVPDADQSEGDDLRQQAQSMSGRQDEPNSGNY